MRQSSGPAQLGGMEWEAAVGDTKTDLDWGGCTANTAEILDINKHKLSPGILLSIPLGCWRILTIIILLYNVDSRKDIIHICIPVPYLSRLPSPHMYSYVELQRGQSVAPVKGGRLTSLLQNLFKSFETGFLPLFLPGKKTQFGLNTYKGNDLFSLSKVSFTSLAKCFEYLYPFLRLSAGGSLTVRTFASRAVASFLRG